MTLRVTEGSVRRALRSRGPVSREKLSPHPRARLELELRKGPLTHGSADHQRWTLDRVKTLIGKTFHVGYTVEGTLTVPRLVQYRA